MTTAPPDYADYSTKTADILTSRFYTAAEQDWWTSGSGFWHSANALECLIDTMNLTQSQSYSNVVEPVYKAFLGFFQPPYDLPGWYDDEGWWGVAIQKASEFADSDTYYDTAVQIFQDLCGGWDDTCGGGVWFKRSPKSYPDNFKGSISTELFMVLAARLFNQNKAPNQGDRETFLDWAIKAWLWVKNSGLVDANGLLWGQLEQDCHTVDPKNYPYTYTQGVILGGLCEIYKATGDRSYIDAALPFADITIETMVWPDGVLRDRCETPTDTCNNDAKQFKGIFMRYLGQLYTTLREVIEEGSPPPPQAYADAAARYEKFMQLNANTLWAGYPGGIFGNDWHRPPGPYTPDPQAWIAGILQTSALDCLNCAIRTQSQ